MVTGYGGTYRATVVNDADPMQESRLQVVVPDVYGEAPAWAAASLTGGTPPAVGDVVWVSFERGDTDYPVWHTDEGAAGSAKGYTGMYRGSVVNVDDPLQDNRIQVTVPDIDPSPVWAVPSEAVRDLALPEVGADVWVEYDHGDPAYPRWVGLA